MSAEAGLPISREAGSAHCLQLVIPADTLAVRDALTRMCDALILRNLPEGDRGTVEIVLAEVLNNIVEHAYADDTGEIEITLRRAPEGLICQIVDQGRRMPDDRLPEGKLPPIAEDDLPEGGFGWHLIRTLSQELVYSRSQGRNRLTFRLGSVPSAEQSA
jgi:serine/threonine-protein kinase RsbW